MAEAKSKSKAQVVCTLCDKPITNGKPVIIDDDPFHADCAKAMEQSSGATEVEDEEDDEVEEDTDGEDEGDEDEEDEEEDEKPAPKRPAKVVAKAPAKTAKRVVAEEDDDDEDDEDDEEDDEEEEEVVVTKPAAKKAVAPAKKAAPVKARRPVVEEDDEDEDDEDDEDEEEEEEVVVRKPVAKAATKTKPVAKRAAADEDDEYPEEEEPEARPTKAKTATATKKPKAPAVDTSGWGNPATYATKRYFVYQALKEVTKSQVNQADGPGKPENVILRAKRLQRDWAKDNGTTLSEKDRNFTSMNIGWIHNHAAELKLAMGHNAEAGTYRIIRAVAADAD